MPSEKEDSGQFELNTCHCCGKVGHEDFQLRIYIGGVWIHRHLSQRAGEFRAGQTGDDAHPHDLLSLRPRQYIFHGHGEGETEDSHQGVSRPRRCGHLDLGLEAWSFIGWRTTFYLAITSVGYADYPFETTQGRLFAMHLRPV
ncbi:hypothetical protein KI387_033338, partial [Taxus chinensis]